ncbi:RDD family protein [Luteimonas sp BLCC-B24]|uniref:RDD family protein n=1 Tax=Luteimonas sp. BLCC-B24 TaxID=3025317 RepID=UPI00234CE62C|nr:RDD family protein [Luteimonas sp. BLCC-B24]MDC7806714.1 RDD family protein [Luteimonas sp. BLCC-B24]
MLDTVREVHTPEGVALRLPAAGPVPRAVAWLIDLAIRGALLMVVSIVLGLLGTFGAGLYMMVLFLIFWGYPVAFEALYGGQTPGKRALSLRVVSADGAPIGWMASFVRNLMRTVDMLPLAYGAGLVTSLADPWSRRLGDMVAGTLVIHAPRERLALQTLPVAPLAPAVALQTDEQRAVIAFAERAHRLSEPRQRELADIVAPVSGAHGERGVMRLLGIANWLLGRRP